MNLTFQDMLVPVAKSDCPGGENIEYDLAYQRLEELALGTPAQEMGECVVPGKEPDIRALRKNCEALWQRSRDLRVAVYWTYSKLSLEGFVGFLEGLKLLTGLVDTFWDTLWPELDPDDNDPVERINILRMLSPAPSAYADALFFIQKIRLTRFIESKPCTVRDAMVSEGFLRAQGTVVDPVLLNAEMLAVPTSEVEKGCSLSEALLGELSNLEQVVNNKMGDAGYIDFSSLRKELEFIHRFYKRYSSQVSSEPLPPVLNENGETTRSPFAASVALGNLSNFQISKRSDALFLLKKCAEYFQTTEPTSPLPFLIHRALKMADMNFIELLGEIDQNALDRGREQLGVPYPNEQ